jgi:hypothetical protein
MPLNLPGIVSTTFGTLQSLGLTAPVAFERPAAGYNPTTGAFATPALTWSAARAVEVQAAARRNAPDARFREATLGLMVPADGLARAPQENDIATFAGIAYRVVVVNVIRQGAAPVVYEIGASA